MPKLGARGSESRRTLRRAEVILVLILGGGVFLYFRLVYQPAADRVRALQGNLRRLQSEIQKDQFHAQGLHEIQETITRYEAALARLNRRLPPSVDLENLLEELHGIGARTGVMLDLVKPQPMVKGETFWELPVEIDLRGSFPDFYRFVQSLERLDRLVRANTVLVSNPDLDGKLKVKTVISVYLAREGS